MTREDVIGRFRADMARLLAAADGLPSEMQAHTILGTWSAKDVLAHVAAWDRELAHGLHEVLAGERPRFASYVEDEFNATIVQAARSRSLAEVRSEVEQAHAVLMETLEHVSDEHWRQQTEHTWDGRIAISVASLFDYRYKGETHYGGHASELE